MRFRDLHINIRIRIITSFITRIVGTMIFPFMAIYFSEKIGEVAAGILMLATVLTTVFTSFYGGYIADKIGRKRVIVASQAIQALAFAIMAIANSRWLDSAWVTFFMMLLHSVSTGLLNPAVDAMLIDVSTKENRKFVYSINYWATNLSIAIGALMGGLLFQSYRSHLFVAITAVSLVTLYFFHFFLQESYQGSREGIGEKVNVLRELARNYRAVMEDRRFLQFCLAGLLLIGLEFQTANYVAVRLQKEFVPQIFTLSDFVSIEINGIRAFSIMQAENTILIVLTTMIISKWMRRFKDRYVLQTGVLLYTLGYASLGYSNTLWVLVAAMLVATIGELIMTPVSQTCLAEIVKDEARSSYMAVNGLAFHGARLLGAAGITVGALIPSWVMLCLFLAMGLTGLCLYRSVLADQKQEG